MAERSMKKKGERILACCQSKRCCWMAGSFHQKWKALEPPSTERLQTRAFQKSSGRSCWSWMGQRLRELSRTRAWKSWLRRGE